MSLEIFSHQAWLLQALAHPKRLEILNLLAQKKLSVTEIYSMLDLPQANISQHLIKLRRAGVVTTKRNGKEIFYKLKNQKIRNFLPHRNLLRLAPLVHDPVCGMQLSPKTAVVKTAHQNRQYYFCASGCLKKFRQEPGRYL